MLGLRNRAKIHICFATRYVESTALPALGFKIDFDHIWIVQGTNTPRDKRPSQADFVHALLPSKRLVDFFESRGIKNVDTIACSAVHASAVAAELETRLSEFSTADIIVNITGGMKPMNFGVVNALRSWVEVNQSGERSAAVVYMSPVGPVTVDQFGDPGDVLKEFDASAGLTLDEFLQLRGFEILSEAPSALDDEISAADEMWSTLSKVQTKPRAGSLGAINWTASKAMQAFKDAKGDPAALEAVEQQRFDFNPTNRARPVANAVVKAASDSLPHLINLDSAGICFASLEAASFLGGGWYEIWATEALRSRIKPGVIGRGVSLHRNLELRLSADTNKRVDIDNPVRELDVCLFDGRRLFVLECKTGKVAGNAGDYGIGQDALNKASTVKEQICGPGGRMAIINVQIAPEELDLFHVLGERARREGVGFDFGTKLVSNRLKEYAAAMNDA